MDAARMRKALVAAGTAAVGALALGLFTEIPQNKAGWVALLGGAFCIGIAAGQATYRTRNEGKGLNENGSEDTSDLAQLEQFKAAWLAAQKNPQQAKVLDDDGPLSPGDRRG